MDANQEALCWLFLAFTAVDEQRTAVIPTSVVQIRPLRLLIIDPLLQTDSVAPRDLEMDGETFITSINLQTDGESFSEGNVMVGLLLTFDPGMK